MTSCLHTAWLCIYAHPTVPSPPKSTFTLYTVHPPPLRSSFPSPLHIHPNQSSSLLMTPFFTLISYILFFLPLSFSNSFIPFSVDLCSTTYPSQCLTAVHVIIVTFWSLLFQDFFSDLAKSEEKHKVLLESSNFLVEVVTETVAAEIKEQVLMLNQRWSEVSTQARRVVKEVTVEKCRHGYDAGVAALTQWLDMAERTILAPVQCTYVELRERVQLLEVRYLYKTSRVFTDP